MWAGLGPKVLSHSGALLTPDTDDHHTWTCRASGGMTRMIITPCMPLQDINCSAIWQSMNEYSLFMIVHVMLGITKAENYRRCGSRRTRWHGDRTALVR